MTTSTLIDIEYVHGLFLNCHISRCHSRIWWRFKTHQQYDSYNLKFELTSSRTIVTIWWRLAIMSYSNDVSCSLRLYVEDDCFSHFTTVISKLTLFYSSTCNKFISIIGTLTVPLVRFVQIFQWKQHNSRIQFSRNQINLTRVWKLSISIQLYNYRKHTYELPEFRNIYTSTTT